MNYRSSLDSKGITLKQRLLARLMLLEYFQGGSVPASGKKSSLHKNGIPKELGEMKKLYDRKPSHRDTVLWGRGAAGRRVRPRLPWAAAVGSF